MSRSVQWQRIVSDGVSWHQDQALNATIYILREVGPTSFLLKEDGVSKKFKVSLGDPHICNCPDFKREKNLCKHICWLLLKRFKLDRQNELSYQLGLVEREINQVLKGPSSLLTSKMVIPNTQKRDESGKEILEQRTLTEDDICPICQEQLLSNRLPVTYCRYGCGNSVHIKCMKVWADHQLHSTGSQVVLCPFCREEFGTQKLLVQEFCNTLHEGRSRNRSELKLACHLGTTCHFCQMTPIQGKCYKCSTCAGFNLCNTCYHAGQHSHHNFEFRLKKTQRWRPVPSRDNRNVEDMEIFLGPIARELEARDITDNDYDLLLQLDRPRNGLEVPVDLAGLPEHIINKLPTMKVRQGSKFLAPGRQCRLCLRLYAAGQFVRCLPECGHVFHRQCIDTWLTEDHRRCPLDQQLVRDPTCNHSKHSKENVLVAPTEDNSSVLELVIPGIGFATKSPDNRNICRSGIHASNDRRVKLKQDTSSHNLGNFHPNMEEITFGDLLIQANAISGVTANDSSSIPLEEKNAQCRTTQNKQLRTPPSTFGWRGVFKNPKIRKESGDQPWNSFSQRKDLDLTLNGSQLKNSPKDKLSVGIHERADVASAPTLQDTNISFPSPNDLTSPENTETPYINHTCFSNINKARERRVARYDNTVPPVETVNAQSILETRRPQSMQINVHEAKKPFTGTECQPKYYRKGKPVSDKICDNDTLIHGLHDMKLDSLNVSERNTSINAAGSLRQGSCCSAPTRIKTKFKTIL